MYKLFTGPPAPTVDLTKNIKSLSIVLNWNAVDNVANYSVTWTSESSPTQSRTLTEQSSYTITGLTLDTVYYISVFAASKFCTGPEFRISTMLSAGMYHFHH